jgi:Protein kinase domain
VTDRPGRLIRGARGRYRLQRELHRRRDDGVAVWHATAIRSGAATALKRLPLTSPEEEKRFRREAEHATRVGSASRYAVEIYDYFIDASGVGTLVMEFCGGGNLNEQVDQRPKRHLPAEVVARMVTNIDSALLAAHHLSIVHRDLKPENILFAERSDRHGRPSWQAVLADFGRSFSEGDLRLTQTGAPIGSWRWAAPEQFDGQDPTFAMDVYAWAGVIYFALTGRPPFDGRTPKELYSQHLNEAPQPPSAWRADIPPEVDAALLKALAKEPAERGTAEELGEAVLAGLRTWIDLPEDLVIECPAAEPIGAAAAHDPAEEVTVPLSRGGHFAARSAVRHGPSPVRFYGRPPIELASIWAAASGALSSARVVVTRSCGGLRVAGRWAVLGLALLARTTLTRLGESLQTHGPPLDEWAGRLAERAGARASILMRTLPPAWSHLGYWSVMRARDCLGRRRAVMPRVQQGDPARGLNAPQLGVVVASSVLLGATMGIAVTPFGADAWQTIADGAPQTVNELSGVTQPLQSELHDTVAAVREGEEDAQIRVGAAVVAALLVPRILFVGRRRRAWAVVALALVLLLMPPGPPLAERTRTLAVQDDITSRDAQLERRARAQEQAELREQLAEERRTAARRRRARAERLRRRRRAEWRLLATIRARSWTPPRCDAVRSTLPPRATARLYCRFRDVGAVYTRFRSRHAMATYLRRRTRRTAPLTTFVGTGCSSDWDWWYPQGSPRIAGDLAWRRQGRRAVLMWTRTSGRLFAEIRTPLRSSDRLC